MGINLQTEKRHLLKKREEKMLCLSSQLNGQTLKQFTNLQREKAIKKLKHLVFKMTVVYLRGDTVLGINRCAKGIGRKPLQQNKMF
jgi:hypothetical protein